MTPLENKTQLRRVDEKLFTIDVRGLACPYPQILALNALEGLSGGDILEVVLDNPPSIRDIPSALERRGYGDVDVTTSDDSTWKITVQIRDEG